MIMGHNSNPPSATNPNVWDFLGQMGFPLPQQLLTAVQRLNSTLEQMTPDIHKLVGAAGSLSKLVATIQDINPQDVRTITSALQDASGTGRHLLSKLK